MRRSTKPAIPDHSVLNGSTDVLEHILDHDHCDPDIRNRLDGDTPLHIAVRQRWEDHPGMRLYLGASSLTATYHADSSWVAPRGRRGHAVAISGVEAS